VAAVKRDLQSDVPNERGEAIDWLIWVDSVAKQEKKRRGYGRWTADFARPHATRLS